MERCHLSGADGPAPRMIELLLFICGRLVVVKMGFWGV